MTSSSSRPKLGGAFTQATPFDGLRILAPGEPNAPAPAAPPPLRSVSVAAPVQDDDQVDDDTAEPASDDQPAAAVADDAPGPGGGRGSATTAQPVAAPVDDSADNPAPASRPKGSTGKRATRARAGSTDTDSSPTASSDAATQTLTKLVPVNIDTSVHNQLRQFAARVELPFSLIVLRAIEANAAELADAWKSSPPPKNGGMFQMVDHRTRTRRTEPFAQVQLRLTTADAEVLEGLIR
ncbi:MAG: hypothetical protein ABJD68_15620, partial [Nakamurella sp.]